MSPAIRSLLASLTSALAARPRRPARSPGGASPPSRRRRASVRAGLALAMLAVTLFLFPLHRRFDPPEYLVGTIAPEEIIAPFDFEVPKDPEELEHERAIAEESVLPVFSRVESHPPPDAILAMLRRAEGRQLALVRLQDSLRVRVSLPVERALAHRDTSSVLLEELGVVLRRAWDAGFVGAQDAALLSRNQRVRLRTPDGDRTIPSFALFDRRKIQEDAAGRGEARLGARGALLLTDLTEAFAFPNVVYDPRATGRDRAAAWASVPTARVSVQKGERIVDAHERITPEQGMVLEALEAAAHARTAGEGAWGWMLPLLGRALLVTVMLAVLGGFLRAARPRVWRELDSGALVGTIMLLTLAVAGGIARAPALHPYLIPLPLAAVLLTLLVDDVVALAVTAWLAALIGAVTGWGLPATLVGFVGGTAAVHGARGIVHRLSVYRTMLVVAAANVAAVAGVALVGSAVPWERLLRDLLFGVGSAGLYTAGAMILLPAFEKLFDRVTSISLIELSDLNRPIFKRMIIEANGTYHHSMVIGSLAEAAAEAIGANPLLARVGAYYHDIGKIAKSTYFGENLRKGTRNPHERLTPTMSSLILESHVREGMELAREIGLPRQVAAFIPEHQGTTLMQYFHQKALELDAEVDERDYRYPGPRPQSRETAIVMLADAAEATVRSMDDQSPARIRAVLNRLFDLRVQDGQLDECGLTIADLARIREAFTHVLAGVFHGRVKYQWQKNGGEAALGGAVSERVFHPELETGIGTREISGVYAGPSEPKRS